MYSPIVSEHFLNPRNAGAMEQPDVVGEAGSPQAGEFVVLHLRIAPGDVIADARFQTFGCGPAIAACSVLTEWAKGKRLQQAREMSGERLTELLGGLPEDKLFCAGLAVEALHSAVARLAPLPW